jgi:hypothetical protein
MNHPSRVKTARRRLQVTRYAIGVIAAGIFAGGVAVARAAHPGAHGSHGPSGQAAIPSESAAVASAAQSSVLGTPSSGDDSGSSGGSVSPAPATSPPVVQSSGS